MINPSSSQGPTDDLRVKPDISGDGTGVISTYPGDTYATLSGTSMSSPNVTGSLVLLQQYYNQLNGNYMLASTLKGLVCHTATDDTNRIGPDPYFGWGLLNSKRSAEVILDATNNSALIDELTIDNNESYVLNFVAQSGDVVDATICWTDLKGVAATSSADLNNSKLVNDLDLRISKDGVTFMPWKLDYSGSGFSNSKGDNTVDNIERVTALITESGTYTLTVTHKGQLQSIGPFDPNEQDFSLILTGNNLTLGTLENDYSNELVIYPNPSDGNFKIIGDSSSIIGEKMDVTIYDISGRLINNFTFDVVSSVISENISLNEASAGLYVVKISNGNFTASYKIVVE